MRWMRGTTVSAAGALVVSGCSGPLWSGPSASEQARARVDAFVAGLGRDRAVLGPHADEAGATKRVAAAYRQMGQVRPTVAVDAVTVDEGGDTATARLTQTWRFAPSTPAWTYDTDLRLRRGDDGWRVQ